MYPAIQIGSLQIPLYGITFLAGLALAIWFATMMGHRVSLPKADVLYGALFAFIGILVGSKIVYLITTLPSLIQYWNRVCELYPELFPRIFFILTYLLGGYVYYGGLIGAILFLYMYCRLYKVDFIAFIDLFAVFIPFVHGIGRIACFLAGCCYGIEYHGPFAVHFPYQEAIPELCEVPRFPVQLLEAGLNFVFFGVLLILFFKTKIRKGRLLGIYLLYYVIARFFLEMLRGDSNRGSIGILSTSQIISLILLPIGILIILKGLPEKLHFRIPQKKSEPPAKAGSSE